tara:strand:+ start:483 stop:1121 length:639 start_codon:yes stop_codon:yes gene_type:complete
MFNPTDVAHLRARTWLNNQIIGRPIHPATLTARDHVLDKVLQDKPEYKRFVQYLTGGVKDDVITELSPEVKAKVVEAHNKGLYPERQERIYYKDKEGNLHYMDNQANLTSTKLSTYPEFDPENKYIASSATQNQLGNIDSFEPDGEGGFILKDKWSVTPEPGTDRWDYVHDLQEGGPLAAWLYRGAKALGTNRDFRYKVPFSAEEMQQYSQP